MVNKKVVSFFILYITLFSFNCTYSQKKDEEITNTKFFWGTIGFGTGANGGNSSSTPYAVNLNLTYRFNRDMVSFRTSSVGELFETTVTDYGFLYGYAITSGEIFTSVGGGIALVSGNISKGLFSEVKKIGPTIGFPAEVQLFWQPFHAVGIGLYLFADLNPENSFDGATLSLQFGNLR
jgi:hypothetical protein